MAYYNTTLGSTSAPKISAQQSNGKRIAGSKSPSQAADTLDEILFGSSAKERAAADAAAAKAAAAFDGLESPEGVEIDPELVGLPDQFDAVKQGDADILSEYGNVDWSTIDPSFYQAVTQGDSALNDIELDPRYKEAQDSSLSALQEIASGNGLTAQDKAELSKIQSDVNAQDRGRRGAILQNAQARGMGGSGLELLNQLQSAQDASTRQSQADLDVAGMAQARKLDAILKSGQLGQSANAQDFGQKSEQAQANDVISRFNTQLGNDQARYQADAQNQANQFNTTGQYNAAQSNRNAATDTNKFNIGNKMDVSSNNANLANSAGQFNVANSIGNKKFDATAKNDTNIRNAGLGQQKFENNVAIASGKAGAYKTAADYATEKQRQRDQAIADRKSGLLKLGAAVL